MRRSAAVQRRSIVEAIAPRHLARMRPHLITWLAACTLTIVPSAPAGAQNLLSNPDFAGTASPWTACDGDVSLAGERDGCSDTSATLAVAAEVDCGLGSASYEAGIRQCVPLAGSALVAGSSKVFFSGWVFVDQNVTAGIALRFFAGTDCSGVDEISGAVLAGGSGYAGIWKFWTPLDPVPVPAGTLSIEYQAIGIDHDGTWFLEFFDDAYLGTATVLYTDGFEHASPTPCHWHGFAPG